MFLKPLSYGSHARSFMARTWAHGKVMASKADGLLRQGMHVYGAIKPIVQEAASAYGGARTQQALGNVDRTISKGYQQYKSARSDVVKGAALADRLASQIGGF